MIQKALKFFFRSAAQCKSINGIVIYKKDFLTIDILKIIGS